MTEHQHDGNPFRSVKYIPSVDEVISIAFKQANTVRMKTSKRRTREEKIATLEKDRISKLSDVIAEKLQSIIKQFPWIENIHPFYIELCDLLGSIDQIKRILGRIDGIANQIKEIEKEQLSKLKLTDHPLEMAKIRKENNGRIASLVKKARGDINYLRRTIKKLKNIPDFNVIYPTIVVAGAPNVGKSSLVREISTGKPEVGEYPFTTKEIVFGHRDLTLTNIQIVDTPGLLDRPFKERNLIERQSITSVRYISDIIVFIFDISKDAELTFNEQMNLFEDIKTEFINVPIIKVLNKIDLLSKEEIDRSITVFGTDFHISTKEKINIDSLIKILEEKVINIVKTSEKFKELQKITISEEFLAYKEKKIDYEF
ncbi:GTP-binding protein [Candidatus Heimdallarchaeota archaeon]|nr:MAG: GTP-binding protein [Candidatus Heimdallarchaeota archaeon]